MYCVSAIPLWVSAIYELYELYEWKGKGRMDEAKVPSPSATTPKSPPASEAEESISVQEEVNHACIMCTLRWTTAV